MAFGFKWRMCTYVGGDYAVHPNFKTYMLMNPEDWAAGEISVPALNTSDIVVTGLGFKPTLLMLCGWRPRRAGDPSSTDTSFGNRGGGMTFGVAGLSQWGSPWSAATTYHAGDVAEHSGTHYIAVDTNTNSTPPSAHWTEVPSAQFTGSTRIRQGWDIMGMKRWREDRCYQVVHGGTHGFGTENDIVLILNHEFTADGFTLHVEKNTYGQADPLFWLALDGNYQVGVMDAGTTELTGFNGTPQGAVFLSCKWKVGDLPYAYLAPGTNPVWDHMQGFASLDGQNCIWGGEKHASWGWTTERWSADRAILLCQGATGSFFAGASVKAVGNVTDFHAGGIDIQWDLQDGFPYRIGWILSGQEGEVGYLEANFDKRLTDQFQPTRIRPDVILMATTNYQFDYGNHDSNAEPQLPDQFWKGGGGGIGWHVSEFTVGAGDAFGVHTYGNAVQEMGHYANSATILSRGCIMLAAGANSNPPAQHQHGINVIPNPRWVGLNWREAERHVSATRALLNPSNIRPPP